MNTPLLCALQTEFENAKSIREPELLGTETDVESAPPSGGPPGASAASSDTSKCPPVDPELLRGRLAVVWPDEPDPSSCPLRPVGPSVQAVRSGSLHRPGLVKGVPRLGSRPELGC